MASAPPERSDIASLDAFDDLLGGPTPPDRSAVDIPLLVTCFPDAKGLRKTERSLSLRELAEEIGSSVAAAKDKLPLYKLAGFGDRATDRGCLRNNANVLSVSGVEADYDGGEITLDEAERIVVEAGIAALVYSTPSSKDDHPRWRVFAPFSRTRNPDERDCSMERLNGLFNGQLDPASFTLSQSYYAGSVEGKPPVALRLVEGSGIDLAVHLDATALKKGAARTLGEVGKLPDETGSAVLFRLAAEVKQDHGTIDDLRKRIPGEPAAQAHIEKAQRRHGKLAERAIQRAWERAPGPRVTLDFDEEFDDLEVAEDGGRLKLLTPAQCAASPSRGYVIKDFLAPGDLACIFGPPGTGKSLLTPYLGFMVARGDRAYGMRTKPGMVLYVAAEDSSGMRGRVAALRAREGDAERFLLVDGISDLLSPESRDLDDLRAAVVRHQPAIVVIDTLAAAFPGLEENDAKQMGRVVEIGRGLSRLGPAVVLVHHDAKHNGVTPRGHSVLNGALDMAVHLTKDEEGVVRGRLTKNRNGSCEVSIAFRIALQSFGEDEDGDPIRFAAVEKLSPSSARRQAKLSPSAKAALDVLKGLLAEHDPVEEPVWRQRCIDGRTVSGSEELASRKKAFSRAISDLAHAGIIRLDGEKVRLAVSSVPDFLPDPFDMDEGQGGTGLRLVHSVQSSGE